MQQQATHCSTAAAAASQPTGPACCSYCGAPDIVLDWAQRFKLLVCTPCFRKNERLVSKSNAKSAYLLSDSDLQPLGFVEKQNPQHQKWSSMKQYLVSQVWLLVIGVAAWWCLVEAGLGPGPWQPHSKQYNKDTALQMCCTNMYRLRRLQSQSTAVWKLWRKRSSIGCRAG